MWIDVVIRYASAIETRVETQCGHVLAEQVLEQRADRRLAEEAEAERGERDADLRRREVAREVVHHASPRSRRRVCPRRRPSAGAPCRERTSANSAATKNALRSTRTRTASSSRAIMRCASARRYFGRSRRRSSRATRARIAQLAGRRCARPSRGRCRSARPSECVVSVSRTLFQPWTRMSGWWLASSASVGHAVDERHRRARSPRTRSRGSATRPPAAILPSEAMRIVSLVPSATEMLFALGARRRGHRRHPRVRLPGGRAESTQGHARRDRPRPRARRDRPRRARADRAGPRRSTSSTSRACARLRARPDRHPGAVQRLRGLRRRRARDRRADGPGAGDRLAGPAHARRGARRRPHARPGHGRQGRGRRPRPGRRRAHRPRPARRARTRRAGASRCSSGSTRSSSAATGCRS